MFRLLRTDVETLLFINFKFKDFLKIISFIAAGLIFTKLIPEHS